jgi:hypothetical protein
MKNIPFKYIATIGLLIFIADAFFACKKTDTTSTSTGTATVPDVYKKIYGASSITSDGTYITIKTTNLPDHKSVYYPTTSSLYEAFSGTTYNGNTFSKNPNSISSQSITIKIPLNPTVAASHAATPLGPIGIALNGVVFFNQYAAGGSPLTNEVDGFDQYWGHPQNSGVYHYHVEPKYLTQTKFTSSALLGFLLDGFPVYGPQENGKTLTDSDLDSFHGHTSVTAEYPNGIYHYHFTQEAPYLNGAGFYGTAGTISN